MTAGSLMTSLFNCFLIIYLGTKSEESDGAKEAKTAISI